MAAGCRGVVCHLHAGIIRGVICGDDVAADDVDDDTTTLTTTVTMVVTIAYCLNDKTKMTVAAHTRYMASWVLVTSDDDIVSV